MEINKKNWVKPTFNLVDMFFGKVPPQAKEMEEAVLGAIMLEINAFDVVADFLTAESFYSNSNKLIFSAIKRLSDKNQPIDLLTIVEELRRSEDLEIVGGPHYISKLTNNVVSSANIEIHARIVAQKFIQRELIRISGEIIGDAYEDSTDVFDLLDESEGKLSKLINGNNKKTFVGLITAVAESVNKIELLRLSKSDITGVPSGFTELDKITHGWQDTDLIILAARPSVGKTAFAGNIARVAAGYFIKTKIENKPKSVAFFSLEMNTQKLVNRLLSAESKILLDQITTGKINDSEMSVIYSQGVEVISNLPIFIDDTAALNIFELRSRCRQLKNKHNLGIIIIDYLQLMSGGGDNKNGNREQEISKISRDLKGLAKELKVPIIALSQLSRKVEDRKGDKIPQLSDLRESGAIEQDADIVMFLYRPEYYDITANEMGDSTAGETHVKIAKHRDGALGTVKLRANLTIQKFYDWDGLKEVKNKMLVNNWQPVKDHFSMSSDIDPF